MILTEATTKVPGTMFKRPFGKMVYMNKNFEPQADQLGNGEFLPETIQSEFTSSATHNPYGLIAVGTGNRVNLYMTPRGTFGGHGIEGTPQLTMWGVKVFGYLALDAQFVEPLTREKINPGSWYSKGLEKMIYSTKVAYYGNTALGAASGTYPYEKQRTYHEEIFTSPLDGNGVWHSGISVYWSFISPFDRIGFQIVTEPSNSVIYWGSSLFYSITVGENVV